MPRILLAEDNPADVFLLREAFTYHRQPVDLHVVSDGEQALDFIDAVAEGAGPEKPDLIVLDLNLPKSDGSDILRRIRERPELHNTPVVVLTSSDSPQDRSATASLGASSFLTKPSDLDAFLQLGGVLLGFLRNDPGPTRAPQLEQTKG